MKNKQLFQLLGFSIASLLIIFSSCRKINEATELGGDLIPPVDNITTFDTTLTVEAYNDLFTSLTDSQYLTSNQTQFLGKISNDPLFGGTDARMFFELKHQIYPSLPFTRKDSLTLDSVVLVLDYLGTYGDTTVPQTVQVYEINQNPAEKFSYDSVYLIRKEHVSYSNLLGSRTFQPSVLNDSVFARKDTTTNQLRIRLDDVFGQRLMSYDSASGPNGAYANDSSFRTYFKGFAVKSTSGNAVMGFNLGGVNTKLAFYYRYPKAGGLGIDTAIQYFRFTTLSASAQYVERDHSFGEIAGVQGGASPDQLVYIQSTPGSFARIKIPALSTIGNRLIHRAELIMEQVYDQATDTLFPPPIALYLDAFDPTIPVTAKPFRTIPYDFSFDAASGSPNLASLGCYPLLQFDPNSGKNIRVWKFNISRYVQHVLTGTSTLYDLRLSAPFTAITQYGIPPVVQDITQVISAVPTIVNGRVRLGGGNHPTQKMRLRLIYSKI